MEFEWIFEETIIVSYSQTSTLCMKIYLALCILHVVPSKFVFVVFFWLLAENVLRTDLQCKRGNSLVRVILFDKVVSIKRLFAFHQYRHSCRHGALTLWFTGGLYRHIWIAQWKCAKSLTSNYTNTHIQGLAEKEFVYIFAQFWAEMGQAAHADSKAMILSNNSPAI